MRNKKRFVHYFGIRMFGMICMTAAGVGVSVLTARVLGADGKGIYTLLYSTLTMVVALLGLTLGFSQAYYKKEVRIEEISVVTVFLSIGFGLAGAVIAVPVAYGLSDAVYKGVEFNHVLIMLCLVPVLLLAMNLRSLLDADYRIINATILNAFRPISLLLMFGVLVLFGFKTVEMAVYCIAASVVGTMLLGIFMLPSGADILVRVKPNWELAGKLVNFSLKSHVGQILSHMQARFDVFLVAYFMQPADVGLYSVAIAISEILWRVPKVAGSLLLPRLAKETERQKSIDITAKLNRVIFSLTLLSTLCVTLLLEWLIVFAFGEEFRPAVTATLWLMPGVLFMTLFTVLHNDLVIRGHPGKYSISMMLGIVIMLVGDFILIPEYGISGAAAASTLGWMMSALIVTANVIRANRLPVSAFFDVRPEFSQLMSSVKKRIGIGSV